MSEFLKNPFKSALQVNQNVANILAQLFIIFKKLNNF